MDKNVQKVAQGLIMDLFLTNMQLFTFQDVQWRHPFTAEDHGEQVM